MVSAGLGTSIQGNYIGTDPSGAALPGITQDLGVLIRDTSGVTVGGTVALDALTARRAELAERLAEARRWELETIAGREAIIDRMTGILAS